MPLDQDTLANAKAIEGRERLTGAFLIELARIRPDPNQPRKSFDAQSQWELSASIEKLGILQPITVQYLETEDIYQIIAGERRFQAAQNLQLPSIPCWVRTPEAKDVLVHQIVENWQRADLHPFDLADTLAQLRDGQGYTQKQQLTAKQTERLVQEKVEKKSGQKKQGAPIATRKKYTTEKATVVLIFRRKRVTAADVLDALDDARKQAAKETD